MGSLCPANFHMYIPLQVDPLNAKGVCIQFLL
ncbi:hypothetical protein L914_17259 [Phytophthora nicotianae]|uniref:Uncharacterized protein n=1 Tax=Phytophthora nicotianae TaxID=4792 RepID=W2MHT8_PHYNI|nr:hypothetical protein L916_17360 [Phytophthora nicotianae]ETM35927.1 hypothetical protein L914_17259 [Phytophthora nicotianae]